MPYRLLAAITGAGLASGREPAAFFAQYGFVSWVLIGLAVGVMAFLAPRKPSHPAWPLAQTALLAITGGAMLSAAGEVTALTIPLRGMRSLGMAVALVTARSLAYARPHALAFVGKMLLVCLAGTLLLGFHMPPMRAVPVGSYPITWGLVRAMAYGGFGAALMSPIMPDRPTMRSTALLTAGLYGLCNAVLLRHPALIAEPMPFVMMMRQWGLIGYGLIAGTLLLASLAALTAALTGLRRRLKGPWPVLAVLMASLAGFTGAVDIAYPTLGGVCAVMLLTAPNKKA